MIRGMDNETREMFKQVTRILQGHDDLDEAQALVNKLVEKRLLSLEQRLDVVSLAVKAVHGE